MNIDQLTLELAAESERNDALKFLQSLIVDVDERLIRSLVEIISEPTSVEDTNRFTALLARIRDEDFIAPLIEAVAKATLDDSPWLADYMYALVSILGDRDRFYPVEGSFVHLLGHWLLSTGGGEISWKAGDIMAELQHPATRDYLMRGAADATLFHQTRISCLRGLMNQYPEDAVIILTSLANDSDSYVREAVAHAQNYLQGATDA